MGQLWGESILTLWRDFGVSTSDMEDVKLQMTMREQAEKLAYYHAFASMTSEAPAELAERVVTMAPSGFSKVFFGNSGSDANDTAVKLVWYYNNTMGRPLKKKDTRPISRLSRCNCCGWEFDGIGRCS